MTTTACPTSPASCSSTKNATAKDGRRSCSKFLEVTRRGYEYAAQQPDDAAKTFIEALPEATFPEPEHGAPLDARCWRTYFKARQPRLGCRRGDDWKAYVHWLVEQGIVVDANDKVIEDESKIPGGPLFTNALLPGG